MNSPVAETYLDKLSNQQRSTLLFGQPEVRPVSCARVESSSSASQSVLASAALQSQKIRMPPWQIHQMIKASGWPRAAEHLAPSVDFNARLEGSLVPLHWACAEGKPGVVKHMIEHGANVLDAAADGQTPLTMR